MALAITRLHSTFGGEAGPLDLRAANDDTIGEIRAAMDEYAMLVFHDQAFTNEEQVRFARRLDNELNRRTLTKTMGKQREPGDEDAIANISNLDADGNLLGGEDRRRLFSLGDRLWHSDATFNDPPGRYSMLHARVVPPAAGDTQFADMRAAYDALPDGTKAKIDGLVAHHSIVHSRKTLGFDMAEADEAQIRGAFQPLVRNFPDGRKSLYLASHASMIVDWPVPEGRMLLNDLIEHATQPQFVLSHSWRAGDFVIWDNRTTMHRATAYDDRAHARDMRRVTTLDIAAN